MAKNALYDQYFTIHGDPVSDKRIIANKLNNCITNVRPNLTKTKSNSKTNFDRCLKGNSHIQSFYIEPGVNNGICKIILQ